MYRFKWRTCTSDWEDIDEIEGCDVEDEDVELIEKDSVNDCEGLLKNNDDSIRDVEVRYIEDDKDEVECDLVMPDCIWKDELEVNVVDGDNVDDKDEVEIDVDVIDVDVTGIQDDNEEEVEEVDEIVEVDDGNLIVLKVESDVEDEELKIMDDENVEGEVKLDVVVEDDKDESM